MPIRYRTFRNPDPPALVRIWNESYSGRGAAFLQGAMALEHHVLAKPYFDPAGLILAEGENGVPIGFVHVGFGPDESCMRLNHCDGIICALAVEPDHRRSGIGTELLHRAESHLKSKGATNIHVGGNRPAHPFYWGLYGGSEPAGVLASDEEAEPFLRKNGYVLASSRSIQQRPLDQAVNVADARFTALRRRCELRITPRASSQCWYLESLVGPIEMLDFQLQDADGAVLAKLRVWDMDLFGWRWHQPSAGIVDFEVGEAHRRQGIGKYLLAQAVRYLQDQFFTLVETQVASNNEAALGLLKKFGFEIIDEARVYRLEDGKRQP